MVKQCLNNRISRTLPAWGIEAVGNSTVFGYA